MFCDITNIKVQAWKWWDWSLSARREKYIEFWWPNWGNWWRWWDMIISVNPHLNSLIKLHARKNFKASPWENWLSNKKHWSDWESCVLEVPQWTQVKNLDTWDIIDLEGSNAQVVIASWWRWWYGNAHFKSSTRQYPDFAELWEPTKEMEIELELKLIADVWIIWVPSSWKSTLISKITNIKAKIWDYQFTTLVPNVWVASILDWSLVVTDIPGLIEWASEWKWLWIEFLRHISRNSVLIHLLDWNSIDIFKDYQIVQNELKKYSSDLYSKKQIIVVNKSDLLDEESKDIIKEDFLKKQKSHWYDQSELYFISAIDGSWVDDILKKTYQLVQNKITSSEKEVEKQDWESVSEKRVVYTPHLEDNPRYFEINELDQNENSKRVFRIEWRRIVQIAKMTNFAQRGWVERLYDVLKKLWIQKWLAHLWAEDGDRIMFWDWELWLDFRESL